MHIFLEKIEPTDETMNLMNTVEFEDYSNVQYDSNNHSNNQGDDQEKIIFRNHFPTCVYVDLGALESDKKRKNETNR